MAPGSRLWCMEVMTGAIGREARGDLASAAKGDEVAFGRIVAAHHADMHRVCVFVCSDQTIAEDAVQAAWAIAWRKLHTVRDEARLRPWLVSVAVNQARDLMRKRQRLAEIEFVAARNHRYGGGVDPATGVDALDVRAALARLKPEERTLLAMRYVAGFNATELSTALGISPSGVRNRLERLTARLREELEAMIERNAFDRQLEREIDVLAGPTPRIDVNAIVTRATQPQRRRSLAWWSRSLSFGAATAVFVLVATVTTMGWLVGSEHQVFGPPAASTPPASSPSPSGGDTVIVSGTWSGVDPATCEPLRLTIDPWQQSVTRCQGLSFDADDPRLTADGATSRESWGDLYSDSVTWKLNNTGGTWTSRRQFENARHVFVGGGGYEGMNAVLTLSDDGTFSGFLRTRSQPDQ